MGETLLFPSLESLIPYAFGLAWKLARSKEETEDLAQESFLKAWEKRMQFRDAVSVRPWLRSTLVPGAGPHALRSVRGCARLSLRGKLSGLPSPGRELQRRLSGQGLRPHEGRGLLLRVRRVSL